MKQAERTELYAMLTKACQVLGCSGALRSSKVGLYSGTDWWRFHIRMAHFRLVGEVVCKATRYDVSPDLVSCGHSNKSSDKYKVMIQSEHAETRQSLIIIQISILHGWAISIRQKDI